MQQHQEIVFAIQSGNLDYIKKSVEIDWKTIRFRSAEFHSISALYYACTKKQPEIVQYLLDAGVDINIKGQIKGNQIHLLEWLQHRDFASMLKIISSKIVMAIQSSDIAYLEKIDVDWNIIRLTYERNGKTGRLPAIHIASLSGQPAVVAWLVDIKNVRVNFWYTYGERAPLCYAIIYSHLDVVKLLIERQADPEEMHVEPGYEFHAYRAIHWAVYFKRADIVEYLLSIDVDINNGLLHLIWNAGNGAISTMFSHRIITEIKVGNLAYVQKMDKSWLNTPLVDPLVHDERKLPLHIIFHACKYGQVEIVKWLINQDSSLLDRKNCLNQTPLDYALTYDYKEASAVLTECITNNDVGKQLSEVAARLSRIDLDEQAVFKHKLKFTFYRYPKDNSNDYENRDIFNDELRAAIEEANEQIKRVTLA
ncbi:MAG: ankyrin repeat domain-containing protein [Legionellaceae bacterium]|nr:ankyrin repeat domain-containing protein [Legionellaceae bacterium]